MLQNYIPLLFVAVLFWLGTAGAEDPSPSNRIVLSDGEWTTTILPGEIRLDGPDGTSILLSVGAESTRDGKPVRLTEPSVTVIGPMPTNGAPRGPVVTMGADIRECRITLQGIPKKGDMMKSSPTGESPTSPFVGILANHRRVNLRLMEGGRVLQDLPSR